MKHLIYFLFTALLFVACEKDDKDKMPDDPNPSEKISGWFNVLDSADIVSGIVHFGFYMHTEYGFDQQLSGYKLYLDNTLFHEENFSTPSDFFNYPVEWDTRNCEDNSMHTFKLFAYDTEGNGFTERLDLKVIHNYFNNEDMIDTWEGVFYYNWTNPEHIPITITVGSDYHIIAEGYSDVFNYQANGAWILDALNNGQISGEGNCTYQKGSKLVTGNCNFVLRFKGDKYNIIGSMDGSGLRTYVRLEKE